MGLGIGVASMPCFAAIEPAKSPIFSDLIPHISADAETEALFAQAENLWIEGSKKSFEQFPRIEKALSEILSNPSSTTLLELSRQASEPKEITQDSIHQLIQTGDLGLISYLKRKVAEKLGTSDSSLSFQTAFAQYGVLIGIPGWDGKLAPLLPFGRPILIRTTDGGPEMPKGIWVLLRSPRQWNLGRDESQTQAFRVTTPESLLKGEIFHQMAGQLGLRYRQLLKQANPQSEFSLLRHSRNSRHLGVVSASLQIQAIHQRVLKSARQDTSRVKKYFEDLFASDVLQDFPKMSDREREVRALLQVAKLHPQAQPDPGLMLALGEVLISGGNPPLGFKNVAVKYAEDFKKYFEEIGLFHCAEFFRIKQLRMRSEKI